jgi:ribonuclease P protein component
MKRINTYNKKEKLKSRKLMQQVFSDGKSLTQFPIKIFYLPVKDPIDNIIKTGVGAGTKNFKKAVDRNRIKRLLREAYRTEKHALHLFLEEQKLQLAIFILYIDKTLPENDIIKSKMPLALNKLMKAINEKDTSNT